MSDLHFGKPEAQNRRTYLKSHLEDVLAGIDRVVVTGDLFDEPNPKFKAEFDDFRADVERMTNNEIIVVPGNHDVRHKGNKLAGVGEEFAQLAKLRWAPVSVDHDFRTVFFCFNSAEGGDWARGLVGEKQRLDMATEYQRQCKQFPEIKTYFKVALVHHHPYPYDTEFEATTSYQKLISYIGIDEDKFLAFENADEFMEWCSARHVSVVLHGHKHRPRHKIGLNNILVVGCGSTTGVENTPMSYDVITLNLDSGRWSTSFYHDPKSDGSGFVLQNVTIDNR